MNLVQKLIGAMLRPRVRGKARGATIDQVIERLQASRDELMPRIKRAQDTAGNREALNHFVGIERWSQSRIAVARGEPFKDDTYHGYRLPEGASLAELQDAFAATRERSIAVAQELRNHHVDLAQKVRHNDLGDLSVLEWFVYLDDHSRREIIRIRERRE